MGGSEAEKFLEQLQEYYNAPGQKPLMYGKVQAGAILAALRTRPKAYLLDLYNQVINEHSVQYRTLPDLAIIRRAMNSLGDSEAYIDRTHTLPEPEEMQATLGEVQAAALKVKGMTGVGCPDEVRRVGSKVERGDATKYEKHWHWCMTECAGKWTAPAQGPFAEEFV